MAPRTPRQVLRFVVPLAALQLLALGAQFALGFRPFRTAPTRVPFSWDMFAVPIERCDLRFSPPIRREGKVIESLRAAGPPFEWDYVQNRVATYRAIAGEVCAAPEHPERVALRCYVPEGRAVNDAVDCR